MSDALRDRIENVLQDFAASRESYESSTDRILTLLTEGEEPVAIGALDERGRILASQALIDEVGAIVFREMWSEDARIVPIYTTPQRDKLREALEKIAKEELEGWSAEGALADAVSIARTALSEEEA